MGNNRESLYDQLKRRKLTQGIYFASPNRPEKMLEHFNRSALKLF